MPATSLAIADVLLLQPRVFHDDRGHFLETWHSDRYAEMGIAGRFVQDNVSVSRKGVLRGLHFQHPHGQGKIVSCLRGNVFDVAVDVRKGSPTFGKWVSAELSDVNGHQLWIPAGFAHGFMALSDEAVFAYKCTEVYTPQSEHSVLWNDPAIGIEWPLTDPIISPKDAAAAVLADIPRDHLPVFVTRNG